MRTIDVTGGEKQYVVGKVTEKYGESLAGTTLTVGLGTSSAEPATWQAPDAASVDGATALVSLLIDSIDQIGASQYLWVKVADAPEVYFLRCGGIVIKVV